jgi:hypothetical protein
MAKIRASLPSSLSMAKMIEPQLLDKWQIEHHTNVEIDDEDIYLLLSRTKNGGVKTIESL